MSDREKIRNLIKSRLNVEYLEVIDESYKHASHKEAQKNTGGHFAIHIVSPDFKDKTRIERHRMINVLLSSEFGSTIHALSITAKTPDEC